MLRWRHVDQLRSRAQNERSYLVEGEEEILERLGDQEGRHLVLEQSRFEIVDRSESAIDSSAIVEVVEYSFRDLEVVLVFCRLIQRPIRLDEFRPQRVA